MTSFDSRLPAVSVILCVRNGEPLLAEQLAALTRQEIDEPWELVVVDNGCTDDSINQVKRYGDLFPSLTIVPAFDKAGLSYARNRGTEMARGDVVAYCDADDVVHPLWLANLFNAVAPGRIVGGALEYELLNAEPARFWRGLTTPMVGLQLGFDYLPHVTGANFALTRSDLAAIGGFDEMFTGSSDEVDLCFRAQQQGIEVAFAADAVISYRLRSTIREAARQLNGYGRSAVLLYRKHRTWMPKPRLGETVGLYWYLLSRTHQLVRGHRMRGLWLCNASYRWGRVTGSIRERTWFI